MGPGYRYRLLSTFESKFKGVVWNHRVSTHGDDIARQFYEDLYQSAVSLKLNSRIESRSRVFNGKNTVHGVKACRGDASFGRLVVNTPAEVDEGNVVAVGQLANIEIGIEVKILSKKMIAQLQRNISDLKKMIDHFRTSNKRAICIGIAAVNFADYMISYEGDREYRTDGKKAKHPIQEAARFLQRLRNEVAPSYDEFLDLPFCATNDDPYPFKWVDEKKTSTDYGAILTRTGDLYNERFGTD